MRFQPFERLVPPLKIILVLIVVLVLLSSVLLWASAVDARVRSASVT